MSTRLPQQQQQHARPSPTPPGASPRQQPRGDLTRNPSSSSDSSTSSQVTAVTVGKRLPGTFQPLDNSSTASLHSQSRALNGSTPGDMPYRKTSPLVGNEPSRQARHGRTHSQGFFEPSLPSAMAASSKPAVAGGNLTASQIAAQAAMLHRPSAQHLRKRSETAPTGNGPPNSPPLNSTRRVTPGPTAQGHSAASARISPVQPPPNALFLGLPNANASAAAASAAFPRSPQVSPGIPVTEQQMQFPEKELKQKSDKPKMKLFSKPKNIVTSKDIDRKGPLSSPNKLGFYGPATVGRLASASTTSLADTVGSGSSSLYSSANISSSTLVPMDRAPTIERDKEKHKVHFLSRQKLHKGKDKDDHFHLPLSSASSNSRPLDPNAPQSLYSFAPSSPQPTTTSFAKSMSGLDLRHGGRALREKKKEEKAAIAAEASQDAWPGGNSYDSNAAMSYLGQPASGAAWSSHSNTSLPWDSTAPPSLHGLGLGGMTSDDAWPFLRAKLLGVFEGDDLRMPIEDLNKIVMVYLHRCIRREPPIVVIEDLRDLMDTGFSSLEHTLHRVPEERLVTRLVEMWLNVFCTILPYMQAVFLSVDLEFRGHGSILNPREAIEFWGVLPNAKIDEKGSVSRQEIDVRRIVLISYRDTVILPRHDTLRAIFSRLSLDSINIGVQMPSNSPGSSSSDRPGTAHSLEAAISSFNSQGTTLLGDPSSGSLGGRSRATSNTSSAQNYTPRLTPEPSLPTFSAATQSAWAQSRQSDSSRVTELVGRMLQCVSVLASIQSGDEAQEKMEDLSKTLKHNWLGRGRTGRNRKGFVGTRIRPMGPSPAERAAGESSPTSTVRA